MNRILTAVSAVAVAVSFSASVQAQDRPRAVPVEMFSCSWRDGKGMDDLMGVAGKWNKWAEKNAAAYSAWVITPQYRALEESFGVGWIGSWPDGATMGEVSQKWVHGDHGLGQAFDEVVDCSDSHVLMTTMAVHAGDGPPADGLVMFSSCTLEEGATDAAAAAAHGKASAALRGKGLEANSWLFYPALGFGDVDFDYYLVSTFKDYAALGNGFEVMTNKGGWDERMAAMKGVTSCDSPRVYDSVQVRAGVR